MRSVDEGCPKYKRTVYVCTGCLNDVVLLSSP